jgi:ATP-binding cassette subfamily B protein
VTARCISGAARWAGSRREWLSRHGSDTVAGVRAFGRGIRFIVRMLAEAAPRLAAAMVLLTVVQAALPVLNIRLTQMIVNGLASRQVASALFLPLGIYLALHLTAAGLAPTAGIVQALVNERLMGQVNLLLLARVNALTELSRFEDPALADELHVIGQRAPHLPRNLLRALMILAQSLLSALGICLLLASLHPLIPLVLLGATLPALLAQRGNLMLTWNVQREMAARERQEQYWLEVGTGAGAAREVQLLGIAAWVRDQFARCLEELERLRGQLRRRLLWRTLATVGLRFSGTTAVFVALAARGVTGQLRPGDFVLFLGSLVLLDGSLAFLPLWIGRVIDEARVTDRFLAFLQPDESRPGERVPLPAGALRRGLEVKHLFFRYAGREESVLRDVSFRIQPGETVALVGRNGAGKTTLVKLLTGLYAPSAGRILIDGRELDEYETASMRARVAVVFQDFGRYYLTAGENIGLGCVEAITDQARIARAAQDGGSEPLLRRLERGSETRLGREFGGTQLSGGEWQTLALSRAFMREADLLILDEPTAALDVRAEAEIYQRFRTLLDDRAGLLISHRFSTVRMADRILVLEDGRIVEEGDHASLLAQGGLYASMFRMQAEAFQPATEVGR